MDISVLGTLFQEGGWGLVLFACIAWGGYKLYGKLSAKFEELNGKIDDLKDQITELKVDSEKYATAIRLCDEPNCKAKKLLEENKQ